MAYNNRTRTGQRTSTTIDPKIVLEDIDQTIHTLEPYAVPLQTLGNTIGTGATPKSHKIQVKQYHGFDNYDYCSAVTVGTGNNTRFALLTLDQISRPDSGEMYYYPQDKLFIADTGQTVEVVMNDRAAIPISGTATLTLPTAVTGNTTTRTTTGTVVVRNIEPYPVTDFTTSDVIFLGRTIYEGQPIEAESKQRDFLFDCNFLEHKEAVLEFTEDQRYLIETQGKVPDWNFQQTAMMKEFKISTEYNALFSEREVDFTIPNKPKRHMRGLFNAIQTNVSYYNPSSLTNFEVMFGNFLYEQAFRYNPNGQYKKMGICGGRFLFDFNQAFREYRRTSTLEGIGSKIGLNLETYVIPGGHTVTLTRSEALRQGSELENWCFVIDPKLMEWRIKKNYNSREYSLSNERLEKVMIEWQGSIAWHLEQAHSLLRTV